MVALGHNHNLLHLENVPGPVHALIGGEACMVHENVLRGHPPVNGKLFHQVHLVVVHPAMVAAHKEPVGHILLI